MFRLDLLLFEYCLLGWSVMLSHKFVENENDFVSSSSLSQKGVSTNILRVERASILVGSLEEAEASPKRTAVQVFSMYHYRYDYFARQESDDWIHYHERDL
jgi:hypothetical protein